jgi:hypothetical protein
VRSQLNAKTLDLNRNLRLTELVQAHVARLVGARLVGLGRAAGLQHFTFQLPAGREVHLHTEAPWRITDGARILVGRADYWRPATPEVTEEALDAGEIGATVRDVRNEALRSWIEQTAPIVTASSADVWGDLEMAFSGGARLEIFADASPVEHDEWEFWRLFERGQVHLVVSSGGGALHP